MSGAIKTTIDEARTMLAAHPLLSDMGFHGFTDNPALLALEMGYWATPATMAREQASLLRRLDEVDTCREFLRPLRRQQKLGQHTRGRWAAGSYRVKHLVEKWVDARGLEHQYIANGSAILAALLEGIGVTPDHDAQRRYGGYRNPNATLAVLASAAERRARETDTAGVAA